MTARLPFTKASLKRAVAAAREAGLRVTGISSDGTLIVQDGDNPAAPLPDSAPVAQAGPASSKWEDERV